MNETLAREIAGHPVAREKYPDCTEVQVTDFQGRTPVIFEVTPVDGIDCRGWPCVRVEMDNRTRDDFNFKLEVFQRDGEDRASRLFHNPAYPLGFVFGEINKRVRGYVRRGGRVGWVVSCEDL